MIHLEREWNIAFATSDELPNVQIDDTFGGTSVASNKAMWEIKPRGTVVCGDLDEVLDDLSRLPVDTNNLDAAIVMFAAPTGMEKFLAEIKGLLPDIPICGAGASPDGDRSSEVFPSGDVSILLIADSRYQWKHEWKNLHTVLAEEISVITADSRTIEVVVDKGVKSNAKEWYHKECERLGCSGNEELSLISPAGYNIHTSFDGDRLHTGTDVSGDWLLKRGLLPKAMADRKVEEVLTEGNSLVFGCAGLFGLLSRMPLTKDNTLMGFFHGEVLTAEGMPRFANLMVSSLTIKESRNKNDES